MTSTSLKARHIADDPTFPWLEAGDCRGVEAFLRHRGWLGEGDRVRRCDKAGEGNMNLTLAVVTDRESMILKQARPWVEKYPDIAAPWDRVDSERRFYERVMYIEPVAQRMPEMLGADGRARALLLEDLSPAKDLTTLYARDHLGETEVTDLAVYARALHDSPLSQGSADSQAPARSQGPEEGRIANQAMRQLNHEHIFVVPMNDDPPLDLDQLEPGLAERAAVLRNDSAYRQALAQTAGRYLSDGDCLLHGDYFPGSWMRTYSGVRVIDPEFCYHGDREFDLGCAVAHFALAGQDRAVAQAFLQRYAYIGGGQTNKKPFDAAWLARYATAEVMRRLIGVAQLPLTMGEGERAALLERSRHAMVDGRWERLWT